jgi:PilZ domain-containing protein
MASQAAHSRYFKKPSRSFEGRRSRRRQTIMTGKIACRGSTLAFNCTIRDISETGARLGVSESHALPARFFLFDTKDHHVHDAIVVWVAYGQRGVRFTASYSLDHAMPPELDFLKRLWSSVRPQMMSLR